MIAQPTTGNTLESDTGDSRPIGVFDSGVGGLSVLAEIRQRLPAEHLLYLADSSQCPYGGKPSAEIAVRARTIGRALVDRQAKALVVACNTATVAAVDELRETFPTIPIVGMEPGVKPAVAISRRRVVGVLATGATLSGERFAHLAQRFADGVELLTQPCPGLVEQVEAGDLDGPVTQALLVGYLAPLRERGVDVIVLGCTHYFFLRDAIQSIVGPGVFLIDTGQAVARRTEYVLRGRGLLAPTAQRGIEQFFSTGPDGGAQVPRLWRARAQVARLEL